MLFFLSGFQGMSPENDLPGGVPNTVSQPCPFYTPSPKQIVFNTRKPIGETGTEMARIFSPNQDRGKSDNEVEPGGEEGSPKTKRPLYMEGKEGHRPCPVTLTGPGHETWGEMLTPSAETRRPC